MEVSGRKVDKILCEPCGDNGQKLSAVGFCVDCCEFLCIKCYKHHCRARPFRNHLLQDKETMPRLKPESTTLQITGTGDKCSKHQGEIIKYYCRSDHQLGCGSCMITNHRRCEELLSIDEEYEKFEKEIQDFGLQLDKNSQTKDQNSIEVEKHHLQAINDVKLLINDIKEYFAKLEIKMVSEVEKVKEKDKKKMESISATCMTLRNDLQSLTSDLSKLRQSQQNGKLFTMMEEARDQMKTIAKDINGMSNDNKVLQYTFMPEKIIEDLIGNVISLGKLDIDVKHNSNDQTEIHESSDEIHTTLHATGSTPTDSVIKTTIQTKSPVPHASNKAVTNQATAKPEVTSYKYISAQASSIHSSTENNATIRKKTSGINNQTSQEMTNHSENVVLSSNASISTSSTRVTTDIQPYPFKPRRASEVSDIPVNSSADKQTPDISGIVLLPGDQFVLADNRNAKVKLVNTKQKNIVTELKLFYKPWDITAVNNNQVAMTMPDAKQIQLVTVSNTNLSQGHTIKVKGQCHGIVYFDGKFIITYTKPAKIEIILINGNVFNVIDKGPNGESLFEDPWYIAISPDNTHVYISDYNTHTVTCMTFDGKVKNVYRDESFKSPRGLTVDQSGSVYVACNSWPHYIYQISSDCSQGQELQGSGLRSLPRSITYCHKEEKLYVGYYNRNNKVLQLK